MMKRNADWHIEHNQRVAHWHEQHTAKVMAGKSRLDRWERFVYKNLSRMFRVQRKPS